MMRLPTVAGPVPPVTYPPLLQVDGLVLVLHLEISRDPVGSVIAATPSTQRNPKELLESCPAAWMHTIQNVRTEVRWLTSIYGSAVGERVQIAFERDALRAPYVFTNRKAFRQLTRIDVQIGKKLCVKVYLPAVFGCKALVCVWRSRSLAWRTAFSNEQSSIFKPTWERYDLLGLWCRDPGR